MKKNTFLSPLRPQATSSPKSSFRGISASFRGVSTALLAILFTVHCSLFTSPAGAQPRMKVTLTNGRTLLVPTDSIASIAIESVVPQSLALMAGQWQLIASANGSAGEGGIHTAKADTINFTATVAPDGRGLLCQTSRLFTSAQGTDYPAEWRILVEEDNAATGRIRLGWVLSADEPASTAEFNEPRQSYLEDGFYYWGSPADLHHYIYLLSENIDTQRLEGMTLWSPWQQPGADTFTLPQQQEVYGVVSTAIPYQSATSTGYFEIWASPRLVRVSSATD